MAEAFAVLGITANIAQFVTSISKLIKEGNELYKSSKGIQEDHREAGVLIGDVEFWCGKARNLVVRCEKEGPELSLLAVECENLLKALHLELDDLRLSENPRWRWYDTVKKTLRSAGKRNDLANLQTRLLRFDERLRSHVTLMLQQESHAGLHSAILALDGKAESMHINVNTKLDQVRLEVLQLLQNQSTINTPKTIDRDDLASMLSSFTARAESLRKQEAFLASLRFEDMERRRDMVKDAHKKTLDWMFDGAESRFVPWLESGSGLYWVKGKAGSGKSTLMNYICDHKRTLQALKTWAGPCQLVTASFFFWISGTYMQKSRSGLLQSLLYQILLASPDFITRYLSDRRATDTWSVRQLINAVKTVTRSENSHSTKYCFFIDGLDEYGENEKSHKDHGDIVDLLTSISAVCNVKLCISSRPWPIFLYTFENLENKIAVEDLTRDDMEIYVNDMFSTNENFTKLSERDPRFLDLARQIVFKAQGVWLWVYLVTRDLLRDIQGKEDYAILARRLEGYPDELKAYFTVMLDNIEDVHKSVSAKILLILLEVEEHFPAIAFDYLLRNEERPLIRPEEIFALDGMEAKEEFFRDRESKLNSRCRDLVQIDTQTFRDQYWPESAAWNFAMVVAYLRVEFLHRTVKDFLSGTYRDCLCAQAGAGFNPTIALFESYLSIIEAAPLPHGNVSSLLDLCLTGLIFDILHHSMRLESQIHSSGANFLDQLHLILTRNQKALAELELEDNDIPMDDKSTFFINYGTITMLGLAAGYGIFRYVTQYLEHNGPILPVKHDLSVLHRALRLPGDQLWLYRPQQLQAPLMVNLPMLELLVSHGANINEYTSGIDSRKYTVWSLFLQASCEERHIYLSEGRDQESMKRVRKNLLGAMDLFLDAGADIEQTIRPLSKKAALERFEEHGFIVATKASDENKENFTVREAFACIFGEGTEETLHLHRKLDELSRQSQLRCQSSQSRPSFLWRLLGYN